MNEIMQSIANTPIPTILVVFGSLLSFFAIGGQLTTKINTTKIKTKPAGFLGGVFIIVGVLLYILPTLVKFSHIEKPLANREPISGNSIANNERDTDSISGLVSDGWETSGNNYDFGAYYIKALPNLTETESGQIHKTIKTTKYSGKRLKISSNMKIDHPIGPIPQYNAAGIWVHLINDKGESVGNRGWGTIGAGDGKSVDWTRLMWF